MPACRRPSSCGCATSSASASAWSTSPTSSPTSSASSDSTIGSRTASACCAGLTPSASSFRKASDPDSPTTAAAGAPRRRARRLRPRDRRRLGPVHRRGGVATRSIRRRTQALDAGATSLPLWVALCYRECPSDPAPAPRDPCGCDAGGCEFARIREGFQLKLLTDEEAKLIAPKDDQADAQATNGSNAPDLARIAAQIAGAECPEPPDDPCLLLASFQATLDTTGKKVVDISRARQHDPRAALAAVDVGAAAAGCCQRYRRRATPS